MESQFEHELYPNAPDYEKMIAEGDTSVLIEYSSKMGSPVPVMYSLLRTGREDALREVLTHYGGLRFIVERLIPSKQLPVVVALIFSNNELTIDDGLAQFAIDFYQRLVAVAKEIDPEAAEQVDTESVNLFTIGGNAMSAYNLLIQELDIDTILGILIQHSDFYG